MKTRSPQPPAAFPAHRAAAEGSWILRHWQQLLLGLAAAFAAVLLTATVVSRLRKAEERGWEQLSVALSQASRGSIPEAVQTLDALAIAQRSGPLAVQTQLMRSSLLHADGRNEDALAAARDAQRQASSDDYKALADLSVAFALEAGGSLDEAEKEYVRFIADHPDHFLVPRANAQTARLRAALGRPDEARATYEKLITLYPGTPWAEEAKAALEALNSSR